MADQEKILVEIGAKIDALRSDLNKGKKELASFQKSTISIAKQIGAAFGLAFGVREILRFTGEVSRLAGQAEGVENAFKRIATPGLLDDLRQATKGTASDFELMKAAVQANNFKIPLEQLGSLLKFAQKRATETGQSVDYLVQSIVLGIGRKSPLILDNLGISAIELRDKLKGAGVEAASVADIAAIVGQIAERELKKAGDEALTTAEKTSQLNAEWENTKITFGEGVNILKTGLIPILSNVLTHINKIMKAYGLMFTYGINGAKAFVKAESELPKELAENSQSLIKLGRAKTEDEAKQMAINNEIKKYTAYLSDATIGEEQQRNVWEHKLRMLRDMQTGYTNLSKVIEDVTTKETATKKPDLPIFNLGIDKSSFDISEAFDIAADAENMAKQLEPMLLKAEEMKYKFQDTFTTIADGFANMTGGMGEGMDEFASNFGNAIKQIIGALLGQAVAMMIVNGIKAAGNAGPLALALAPALGAAGAGIAKSLFSSLVPSFANEGQVNRPTLAMVGDYAGAASNPEFMLKKSTLEKLGGGSQQLYARIGFDAIYLANKKYGEYLRRTT